MTNVSILLILAVIICEKLVSNMIHVLKCIGSSNLWMRKFIF